METYILDDSDDMWSHFAKLIGDVSWPAGKYLANEMLGGRLSDWERVIVLMDQRFNQTRYRQIFPRNWTNIKVTNNAVQLKNVLQNFWRNGNQ